MNLEYEFHSINELFEAMFYGDTEAFYMLIDKMHTDTLNAVIDSLIDYAIYQELHEITVYLLDYKAKNNLYIEPDWKL